ncbi:Thiosulfate sulfurtransferase GlpE [compost metagenome]
MNGPPRAPEVTRMTDFKRIAPDQAQQLRADGAQVVDIRDPQSFAMGHISGSQHVDNYSVADFIRQADLDAPLVVVCYHGNSSQSAAAYFIQQGFTDVYSLDGGFELWRSVYPADTSRDGSD